MSDVDMNTMQEIYAKGWKRAAEWAGRGDIQDVVGSPSYLKDMASDLTDFAEVAMQSAPAESLTVDKAIELLVDALARDGWLRGYADAIVRCAINDPAPLMAASANGIEPEQGESHE